MPNRDGTLQAEWQAKFYELTPYSVSPSSWWYNPTNHNSLRLTQKAYLEVRKHVKFHKFELIHDIKPKTFVQLERWFKEPYYVQNRKTIHIVSERDAMMLALHANNLQQYLDNQSL
jgi:hypothetical protein